MSVDLNQLNEDVDSLYTQVEKLDEYVSDHEDQISGIVCALLDEPCLSEDAKHAIKELYNQLYKHPKSESDAN